MDQWWMTIPESLKEPELLRSLSYPGSAAFGITAIVCALSIVLVLTWLLAVQRYTQPRRKG